MKRGQFAAAAGAAAFVPGTVAAPADGAPDATITSTEHWATKGAVKLAMYRKRPLSRSTAASGGAVLPVLFLVHGSSMAGRSTFDLTVPGHADYSMMDAFARRGYDVWTMDHEGYGRSDRTSGNSDIASGVADLRAAMDVVRRETGRASAHFFGESSGGIRAAAFAIAEPRSVERLGLSAFTWTGAGSPTLANRAKDVEFYRTHNVRPATRELYRSIFTRDKPGTADPAVGDALAGAEAKYGDSVPTGTYLDMITKLPLVDPAQLHVPVLMARGEYDGISSEEDLIGFFTRLANRDKQFVVVPGAAHSLVLGYNRAALPARARRIPHAARARGPPELGGAALGRHRHLDAQRRHRDDGVRPRGDLDSRRAKLRQDAPEHRVLGVPRTVVGHQEPNGDLDPVVGEPVEAARRDVGHVQAVALPQAHLRVLCDRVGVDGELAHRVEHDALGALVVAVVRDRQHDLVPDVRKIARVVVDGLIEDDAVRHGHDAPRELAAVDPQRRRVRFLAARFAHLHDRRLERVERDHVAANAAHDDAVADGERGAAQDDDVRGDRRDDALQREGDARAEQSRDRREPRRVVEPDRRQRDDERHHQPDADDLAGPERDARRARRRNGGPRGGAQQAAQQAEAEQECDRQAQLDRGVRVEPDEVDAEDRHFRIVPVSASADASRTWGTGCSWSRCAST